MAKRIDDAFPIRTCADLRTFEAAFPDAIERIATASLERIAVDLVRAREAVPPLGDPCVEIVGVAAVLRAGEVVRVLFEVLPKQTIRVRSIGFDRTYRAGDAAPRPGDPEAMVISIGSKVVVLDVASAGLLEPGIRGRSTFADFAVHAFNEGRVA